MTKKRKLILISVSSFLLLFLILSFSLTLFSFDRSEKLEENEISSGIDDFGGMNLYKNSGELIGSDYINVNTWGFYDLSRHNIFSPKLVSGSIVNDSEKPSFMKINSVPVKLSDYSYITIEFEISSIFNYDAEKPIKIIANEFTLGDYSQKISDKVFKVEASDDSHMLFNLSYDGTMVSEASKNAKITYVIRSVNFGKINDVDYLCESDMLIFVDDKFVAYEENFNTKNLQYISSVYANYFHCYHNGQSAFGFGNVTTNVFPLNYSGSINKLFDDYLGGYVPDIRSCPDIKSFK